MDGTTDIETIVRSRLKSLRVARGWSLDELARRSNLGPSTLSRIETGKRTIGIDVLVPLAKALMVDVATLLDTTDDADVVIRPAVTTDGTRTVWALTRDDSARGIVAAKWRLEPTDDPPDQRVHPGHDWFFVLSGAVRLTLGERTIIVEEGEAAEFSTMLPHAMTAHEGPAELLTVFDRTGHDAHLVASVS